MKFSYEAKRDSLNVQALTTFRQLKPVFGEEAARKNVADWIVDVLQNDIYKLSESDARRAASELGYLNLEK